MNELGDVSKAEEGVDDEVEADEDKAVEIEEDAAIEMTGEINVEALVAKIDSTPKDDVEKQRQIRQRLDKLSDERDNELESTYNFNLDDELQ